MSKQLLADMRRASALVDAADDATDYQLRLVALGLIARQYLRDLPEPTENRSGFKVCHCGATLPCFAHQVTTR